MLKTTLRLLPVLISSLICLPTYSSGKDIKEIEFNQLETPKSDKDKASIRISSNAKVTFVDGKVINYPISFKTVYRTGDKIGNQIAGQLYNQAGQPLYENNELMVSNRTDGLSIITKNNKNYLMTHYETYPGAIYLAELENKKNSIQVKNINSIDFSSVQGTMINCASSVTPWSTHLSAEEDFYFDSMRFDPNTEKLSEDHINKCKTDANGYITDNSYFCSVAKMMKDKYLTDRESFSPYNYGYIVEVGIDDKGKGFPVGNLKHYAMGKAAPEMAMVMPDKKTVYITDDGDFRGLYLFVADKPGNLSSGNLYAARWEQTDNNGSGKANLAWIKLAHGDDAQIKKIIDRKINFSDIFELGTSEDEGKNGFKKIKSGDFNTMVLRPRNGKNGSKLSPKFKNDSEFIMAVAFLETRRYGAYLGATMEFRKEEGITFDYDKKQIYLAMSELNKSMEDNYKNQEPDSQNHIKLPINDCGAIYKISLGQSEDFDSEIMDTNYAGKKVEELISGSHLDKKSPLAKEHYCDPEKISNPDNLQYIGKNTLLIAEDTSRHSVSYAWAYNTQNKKLTRVMSAPAGGEFSGMFMSLDDKVRNSIFITVQHPFKDKAINAFGEKLNTELIEKSTNQDKESYVGYISGLPSFK